jgi:nucleotide-binding universal stress UspA family protein
MAVAWRLRIPNGRGPTPEERMKIVIGYDAAAAADAALRDLKLAGLPSKAEAALILALPAVPPQDAFAVDPTGSGWLANAYVPIGPTPEQLKRAEEQGARARRTVEEEFPGWTVSSEVVVRDPAQAVLEKAEAWKADLIVVGSHGWTWLGRAFLGSIAQKVLTHAKVNVRLSHPRAEAPAGGPRLLAAIDGSRDARLALDEILRRTWPAGTRVRLIAAKETFPWADALAAAEVGLKASRLEAGSWVAMERILEAGQARLKAAGLEAEWEILEGDPRNVILDEAEAYRADCLFLGRRGLTAFNRFLLGSVSSAVASHAPCSVEVIRRPARVRTAQVIRERPGRTSRSA